MRTSWELRLRRAFGVFAFGVVAVSLAGGAGALGIAFVVLTLALTSLFFVLNRNALGKPGHPHVRGWVGIAGAATGIALSSIGSALGAPSLPVLFAAICSAFVSGVILALVLVDYPDAPHDRPLPR